MARGTVDWSACEADYRTGTYSNRQLAEVHGCTEAAIRDRVKRYGWTKDLTGAVRAATNAKLLRADLRTTNAREDAQIISEAADVRVEVVRQHRASLGRLQRIADTLADRLEAHLNGEAAPGPFLGERESPADLMEKLSRTTAKVITLERQAFNLDEPEREKDGGANELSDTERAARVAALLDRARARGTGQAPD